jgi:DnaK suppressor protein
MAKPKRNAAKRGDKQARPAKAKAAKKVAVKPARVKPAQKAVAKPVRNAAAKTAARSAAKPARKPVAKAAKAARKQAPKRQMSRKQTPKPTPKKVSKVPAVKKATPKRTKNVAVSHKPKAQRVAASQAPAAAAEHGGHGHSRQPTRKPAHVRPVGGVAARLSTVTADEQTITREDGRYALPASVNVDLPKGYTPSVKEEYMNPKQLAYFRQKLKDWRDQLVEESRQTMENLREEVRDVGDDAERATRETENSLELRTRDRYRKLISKIEKALRKIEEGRYGYCEETDEEIGIDRLEARPIATLSLDAQERREHLQKQMGD